LSERIAAKVKNTNASGEAISEAELEFGTLAVEVEDPAEVVRLPPVVEARVLDGEPVVTVPLLAPVVDGAAVLVVELAVIDSITEESDDETEEATEDREEEADEAAELMDETVELEEADAEADAEEDEAAPPMSSN